MLLHCCCCCCWCCCSDKNTFNILLWHQVWQTSYLFSHSLLTLSLFHTQNLSLSLSLSFSTHSFSFSHTKTLSLLHSFIRSSYECFYRRIYEVGESCEEKFVNNIIGCVGKKIRLQMCRKSAKMEKKPGVSSIDRHLFNRMSMFRFEKLRFQIFVKFMFQ